METAFPDRPAYALPCAPALRVIARDRNVLRVDFEHDPDPPAPRFPGAGALRGLRPAAPVDAFCAGNPAGRAA